MAGFSQSIGVFGATGELGRVLLESLEQQAAFVGRVRVFASERSQEETIVFRERPLSVEHADQADMSDISEAFLAVPADVADELAERLLAQGTRVWDCSGSLRAHPQAVSLLAADADAMLIVVDDPWFGILVPVLESLHTLQAMTEVDLQILSPVAARGQRGVRELAGQTGHLLNGRGIEPSEWPVQVAFNVLLSDGPTGPDGHTSRERRLQKLLSQRLGLRHAHVEQLVVPLFYGGLLKLRWRTDSSLSEADVRHCLAELPMQYQVVANGELASPVGFGAEEDRVHIARIGVSGQQGQLWLIADALRAGIAAPVVRCLMNDV